MLQDFENLADLDAAVADRRVEELGLAGGRDRLHAHVAQMRHSRVGRRQVSGLDLVLDDVEAVREVVVDAQPGRVDALDHRYDLAHAVVHVVLQRQHHAEVASNAGKLAEVSNHVVDLATDQHLVVKASGFSWGSRDVTVGHDVTNKAWDAVVKQALPSFGETPYVIQHYHQSQRLGVRYFDFDANMIKSLEGRARISPYYLVQNDKACLSGVLVTVVPASSKVIHGSPVSVIMPATRSDTATITI